VNVDQYLPDPALTGIIDITDHPAGRDPYFKTRKGAE
jgi:hypothetical protein